MKYASIALVCLACTTARVTVPTDPSSDAPPVITVSAIPLVQTDVTGDVEPGKGEVSVTTSVNVTRGARIMLLANAKNRGGVAQLALEARQRGAVVFIATATETRDSSGKALNALIVRAPDGNPGGTLELTIDEPATVKAVATNFNGQSTTVDVTYVPADLSVTLTAAPVAIGYQRPLVSRLTWSVLYGVQITSITGNVVSSGPVGSQGTADVSPSQTTTYTVTAADRSGTKTKSVTVHVYPPPAPPDPKLTASPTEGYVCLGTEVKLEWTVGNCGADCVVNLRGTGRGYAQGKDVLLDRVPRTGAFTLKPADQTDFALTASSPHGSRVATKIVRIAPPTACANGSGSGSTPKLEPFYLLIKPNSSTLELPCSTILVWFDTEANALAAARQVWGSGYTITVIDASRFDTACTTE